MGSVFVIAAVVAACSENSPTGFEPQFAPGGGGPPVKVTATDPDFGEQGATLVVRVLGSNFEPGSVAEFRLGNLPPGKVRTNSTTFVSTDELHVDITIEEDAELGLYDVEVHTPRGKKGVGTELFSVQEKGGGNTTRLPIAMTIADLSTGLRSDGEGAYVDQNCGVYAWLDGPAFMNPDAAKIPKEDKATCGDGRQAVAHAEGVDHELINIFLRPDDWDNPTTAVGTVNAGTLCFFVSGNGHKVSGKGLRFNPDNLAGSDPLNVEKLSASSWRFWTSPYPDNKGWCEDASGIRYVHFDLDVIVTLQ